MENEINVLALVKGEERYVFLYDEENRTETLRMLGRYAANPELSFTWYDAAVMSKKIREMAAEQEQHPTDVVSSDSASMHPASRFSFRHKEDMI